MRLLNRLNCLPIAVILLGAAAAHGQAKSQNQEWAEAASAKVLTARASIDSSLNAGVAEPAVGLPTAVGLPLTPQPILKPTSKRAEIAPSVHELRVWKGLILAEHSAAIFDGWTTRQSVQSGNGYERNPLLKPFADSAAIYPMLQVAPVGLDFLSHRMMRSQNRFFRKTWWVPQLASTGASLWCGARNLRVANLNR